MTVTVAQTSDIPLDPGTGLLATIAWLKSYSLTPAHLRVMDEAGLEPGGWGELAGAWEAMDEAQLASLTALAQTPPS